MNEPTQALRTPSGTSNAQPETGSSLPWHYLSPVHRRSVRCRRTEVQQIPVPETFSEGSIHRMPLGNFYRHVVSNLLATVATPEEKADATRCRLFQSNSKCFFQTQLLALSAAAPSPLRPPTPPRRIPLGGDASATQQQAVKVQRPFRCAQRVSGVNKPLD